MAVASKPPPEPLLSRLGIPFIGRNGWFVGATAIDSIGTGLILAFAIVYFAATTSVSLAAIGAAMTLARLFAVPTSLVVGPLIDRFNARRTAAVGNLVSVVGYVGFLWTEQWWSIVLVVFVVQVGHTTYWTSSSAMVALAAPENRRTTWFGFVHALRNSGMGIGGALGATAFALGETRALQLIVLANAASYVVAAVLLFVWRPVPHTAGEDPATPAVAGEPAPALAGELAKTAETPPTGGYRRVLRDRVYTALIGVNVTLVFAQMLIKVLLAIYIVEALDEGAWIAGALIVTSTVQIALTQTVISRQMERHRRTRVVAAASLLNAVAFGMFAALYFTPSWLLMVGLFTAMAIFTVGEILGFPAMDNLSVSLAPESIRGRYLAVYQLSWTVGEVVAPAVLTALLARGAVLPMVFLLLLSLLAVLLVLNLERRIARSARPDGVRGNIT